MRRLCWALAITPLPGIPPEQLAALGGNKRAPLKVTVNDYTYQSTAAGMDGQTLVVFPTKDRQAAGVASGDKVIDQLR